MSCALLDYCKIKLTPDREASLPGLPGFGATPQILDLGADVFVWMILKTNQGLASESHFKWYLQGSQ